MIANSWTQIAGLIIQVAAGLGGFILFIYKMADVMVNKQNIKAKEAIELAKAEVSLAKENALAASQVATVLQNYREVIEELESMKENIDDMRTSSNDKNSAMLKLINKIEDMVKQQTQNFTEFIMNRAK